MSLWSMGLVRALPALCLIGVLVHGATASITFDEKTSIEVGNVWDEGRQARLPNGIQITSTFTAKLTGAEADDLRTLIDGILPGSKPDQKMFDGEMKYWLKLYQDAELKKVETENTLIDGKRGAIRSAICNDAGTEYIDVPIGQTTRNTVVYSCTEGIIFDVDGADSHIYVRRKLSGAAYSITVPAGWSITSVSDDTSSISADKSKASGFVPEAEKGKEVTLTVKLARVQASPTPSPVSTSSSPTPAIQPTTPTPLPSPSPQKQFVCPDGTTRDDPRLCSTPTPSPKQPGFEAIFAVASLLVVLISRRRLGL